MQSVLCDGTTIYSTDKDLFKEGKDPKGEALGIVKDIHP